ncbi:hypothetical protein AGMMS49546_35900 [Spirochaetia bacterium]|nr:hypothetical protein AGMMS49546_35900 [Spirochaetia bacterium]
MIKNKNGFGDNGNPYPNGYNPIESLRDAFAAVDAKIEAEEAEYNWKVAHDPETQAKRAEGERVWQKIHRLTIGELSEFSREEIEAIAEIDDHIEAWKGDKTKLLKHINRVLTIGADTKEGL